MEGIEVYLILRSIADIIGRGLTVVLPDGKALLTTAFEQTNSFSVGIDFKNLFIGSNASFGVLVDATLKVERKK